MKVVHELSVECDTKRVIKVLVTEKEGQRKNRKVKTWTTQQDEMLVSLYERFPKKWSTISGLMEDRNQNQCLHRYRRLSQMGHHQKIWLEQQDQMVTKLVKKFGKNWKVLSEVIGTKTGKQIRERYINKLDPKIKKEDWTSEQDLQLISLYTSLGSHWSQIAKKLPGRPQNRIKNRFYSYIRRTYNIKEIVVKPQTEPIVTFKEPPTTFQSTLKENADSKPEIQAKREALAVSKQSQMLIQSSSFFLNENLIKTYGKQQTLSITSFSYFPDEDGPLYLDYDRGF